MNETEFDNVRRRLGAMFPSLIDWFVALDGKTTEGVPVTTQARRNSMRARWRAALDDVHFDDALAAIDDIAKRPEDPWPFPADKERAAAIVAHEARRISSSRRETETRDRLRASRRRHVDIHGIRANVIGRIESDPRHDDECRQHRAAYGRCRPGCEVPALVAAEINAEPCDVPSDAETYRCALCRDTGLVSVLAAKSIQETAESGRVDPGARQTATLACCCDGHAARNYRESRTSSGEAFFVQCDLAKHVRADQSEAALVVACRAAVESFGGRREASFDEFNRRAV